MRRIRRQEEGETESGFVNIHFSSNTNTNTSLILSPLAQCPLLVMSTCQVFWVMLVVLGFLGAVLLDFQRQQTDKIQFPSGSKSATWFQVCMFAVLIADVQGMKRSHHSSKRSFTGF